MIGAVLFTASHDRALSESVIIRLKPVKRPCFAAFTELNALDQFVKLR